MDQFALFHLWGSKEGVDTAMTSPSPENICYMLKWKAKEN